MPPDLEGTRVALANRYRLDAPIARGGMGTVWRAEDTLLRRPVAVKEVAVPPSPYGQEDAVRMRVMREAQAAARLSHPNTVTVFDVVEQDDRIWLVMELVEAGSLADLVEAGGPLAPQRAATIGVGLVAALQEAHRRGIVHRDVKPGNVLVEHDGTVKLTDFGIASLRDDPRITRTGMVLGSPSYMAPEQARGEPPGPEVDVWGLGATLWYAVEGGSPYSRDSAIATLGAIVNEPIPVATRAGPLGPVLEKLLAKDATRRPSLEDAGRLLAAVAGDGAAATTHVAPAPTVAAPLLPTSADPVVEPVVGTAVQRRPVRRATAPPPRRTSGWGWAVALVAVVALLAGGFMLVAALRDDGDERDVTAGDPVSTTTETTAAPSSTTATTAAPTTQTTAAPSTTEAPTTTATTAPPTTATTTAPPAGVPDGWVSFTEPSTGFVLPHPDGWEQADAGTNRIRFRDPSTGDSVLVEWTDDPGPSALGAWQEQAPNFARTHEGYQEIRLEQVEYKGLDAAVWEFTWTDGGTRLHATDLGMVTGDYGVALFSVAADSRWAEANETFTAIAEAFSPPT